MRFDPEHANACFSVYSLLTAETEHADMLAVLTSLSAPLSYLLGYI